MHRISLVFGGELLHLQGAFFSKMMIDLHPFPVSVSVAALPVTGRGRVTPNISGNCREQAKHSDWSSRARAETEKATTTGRDSALWTSRDESRCATSAKQTLEGWDWSWQMSKSWPQNDCLNYYTYTDVWSDETKRLIVQSSKMFSLHVKKVSCKEQMWIF